jgi:hypothetical protein
VDKDVVDPSTSSPVHADLAPDIPSIQTEPSSSHDWPEPEPASSGDSATQEGSKRKRRRKKGKGGGQSNHATPPPSGEAGKDSVTPAPLQPRPPQPPRQKADPEKIAKLAVKIYLAEVSEEGVALINDHDAKELSRRCFRLAEIFIEEEARQR